MALLTLTDIQDERNIDLTSPEGETVATALIPVAIAWAERRIGYALEESERTEYFSDGHTYFCLAPKATISGLILASKSANAYSNVDAFAYEFTETGEVEVSVSLPRGLKAVKATYTAGWTAETFKTDAADLRSALIDLIALKLQTINIFASSTAPSSSGSEGEEGGEASSTPTGPIKKLSIDGYAVEYSLAQDDAFWRAKGAQLARSIGDDVPVGITEVVDAYRRPLAR